MGLIKATANTLKSPGRGAWVPVSLSKSSKKGDGNINRVILGNLMEIQS